MSRIIKDVLRLKKVRILYVHDIHGHEEEKLAEEIRTDHAQGHNLDLEDMTPFPYELEVDAPAIPYGSVQETLDFLESKKKDYDYIVASFIGAYLSMKISGIKKILLNPYYPDNIDKLDDSVCSKEYKEELLKLKDKIRDPFDDKSETWCLHSFDIYQNPDSDFLAGVLNPRSHFQWLDDRIPGYDICRVIEETQDFSSIEIGYSKTIYFVEKKPGTPGRQVSLMEYMKEEYPEEYEEMFGNFYLKTAQ